MDTITLAAASGFLVFPLFFWAFRLVDMILSWRALPVLDPNRHVDLPDYVPMISVVVPAHNEQSGIRECLDSALDQDYPRLEVILVDDRSTDSTLSIASSLSKDHRSLKIISVKDLPGGWTGKCHALDAGVREAAGEWLAFLDADSRIHRTTLRHCYHYALDRNVNLVTLTPRPILKSFWEKALQPVFLGMFAILFPFWRINDPASKVAAANGMFYLISRSAYLMIGGHREVRHLAVEDIGIGKRVKAAGMGLLFVNGVNVMKTHMYAGLGEILDGWARILAASLNYDMVKVIRNFVVHSLISLPVVVAALYWYVPLATARWPITWWLLPLLLAAELLVVSTFFYRQLGVSRTYLPLLFLGNLMLVCVFGVIVKRILCKDALQWRGTIYQGNRYQPTLLDPAPIDRQNQPSSASLRR